MTRRWILFVFALMSLSGAFVAVFSTIQQRDFNLRGYVDPAQNADLPFRVPRLGINAELTQYAPDELLSQFDLMQAAHIIWVRQFFTWDAIEPERGVYNWDKWDALVDAFRQVPNLRLIAVLNNSPSWARESNDPTAPPDEIADFGAFSSAFAARYGDAIDHYQIWDEPNLIAAWGLEPRPAQYLALLQSAYTAIHSADPRATVIAAALAPTTEQGPKNISDILYLRDLYALGGSEFFDAVGAKPYGFNSLPSDRTVDAETLNFSRVIALREVMVRNGDGKKAIWASNWGWNSLPQNWSGSPSIWGSVNSEQQIQYTLEALDRVEREWPWLAGMILHHWQPTAAPDDPIWGFAIRDSNDEATPLWETLQQYLPPTRAQNGLFFAANPYARYSGVWTFGDLGADIGWINDSRLEFDFTGSDLSLLLRHDNYVAYLYPTIDGQQGNAAPKDVAGNAYVILTSDSLLPETDIVPIARDLPFTQHTLKIIADDLTPDEAQDRWALVGYAVSSGDLVAPYNRQIAVSIFAVVVAAIAVVVTGWRINWHWFFEPFGKLSSIAQLMISAVTSLALMVGMLLTWGDAIPALFRREPVQLGLAIITAGIVYVEPGLILTIIALIVLFVVIYNRIDLGLTLTIFWSPFFLFPVDLYRFAFPMAEITVLLTGVAWGLHLLVDWGRIRQTAVGQFPAPSFTLWLSSFTMLDFGVIAWLAMGCISLSWAALLPKAITELRVMLIEPVLFYIILRTSRLDKKSLLRLVDALLLAAIVVSAVGFWLYVQGEATITAEAGARRLASVYGSPNNVGLFLGRCIPFALAFILIRADRRRRLFAVAALLIMVAAVALSQSAGALFIGIPASVIAVLFLAWGKRALLPILGLAGAGIVGFVVAMRSARFARLLDFSSGTNFARIRVWSSALNMLRDHPITGIGLDQFLYQFRGQYIMPDAWQEPNLSHPHNFILDFWLRLGIFGVLVFVWIQVAFWQASHHAYKLYRTRNPLYFALIIGMMGSMINLLAHGLVDNSVYVQDLAYIFVLLLGLAIQFSNARAIDEYY
jgi:O-antigen ligase